MRKVDDGEKRKKRKENNVVFSGHYVIASSLPPERRPLERRTPVPINIARSFFFVTPPLILSLKVKGSFLDKIEPQNVSSQIP